MLFNQFRNFELSKSNQVTLEGGNPSFSSSGQLGAGLSKPRSQRGIPAQGSFAQTNIPPIIIICYEPSPAPVM